MVSATSVRKAARLMQGARRIAYYAIGDTAVTVEGFSNLLLKLGIVCTNGIQHDDANIVTQMLDARDLAIVVTHSGVLVDSHLSAIKTLRERGCKMVLITSNQDLESRLAGTDCVILIPEGETRLGRVATFFSQECIRYVLNCIYSEIFAINWQENVDQLDRYAQIDTYTE